MTRQPEPRAGIAYNAPEDQHNSPCFLCKDSGDAIQREPCAFESRVRESDVLAPLLACSPGVSGNPAAWFPQRVPCRLSTGVREDMSVVNAEYIWKYTHNAFDFSMLWATRRSLSRSIGITRRFQVMLLALDVPVIHGFSAFVTMSSVAARFFPPQSRRSGGHGGAELATPFRIDHDEKFNQTTHICNTSFPEVLTPWLGFNWRYDSGLVAGSVPFATDTDRPPAWTHRRV